MRAVACASPAGLASEKLEPSRAEAAAPAGSIMLPPSGLQTSVGGSCSIDMDYSPFRLILAIHFSSPIAHFFRSAERMRM